MSDTEEPENKTSLSEYENMPRHEIPLFEKEKATAAFQQKVYFYAVQHYSKALMALSILAKDKVIAQEQLKHQILTI